MDNKTGSALYKEFIEKLLCQYGEELLDLTATAAFILPIDTDPQKFVVAGTAAGIAKMLPTVAPVEQPAAWIDDFGNVWPLNAYSPNGKPNYHDVHKRGWKPLYRAATSTGSAPTAAAEVRDAARWRFMMAVADKSTGPEAEAMERFGNEALESDRPESEQMGEIVDEAMAYVKAAQGAIRSAGSTGGAQ